MTSSSNTSSTAKKLDFVAELLKGADRVLISAGAGLSYPAGINYWDTEHFKHCHPGILKKGFGKCNWHMVGNQALGDDPHLFWGWFIRHMQFMTVEAGASKYEAERDRSAKSPSATKLASYVGPSIQFKSDETGKILDTISTGSDIPGIPQQFADDTDNAMYKQLLDIVSTCRSQSERYFVATTNVDDMFLRSGFHPDRVHALQGLMRLLQCNAPGARGCGHVWAAEPVWDALKPHMDWAESRVRPEHPGKGGYSSYLPRCPKCQKQETVFPNLHAGSFYVTKHIVPARERYMEFLSGVGVAAASKKSSDGVEKVVILELGVGPNSPGALKWPNERLAINGFNVDGRKVEFSLVRINPGEGEAAVPEPEFTGLEKTKVNSEKKSWNVELHMGCEEAISGLWTRMTGE